MDTEAATKGDIVRVHEKMDKAIDTLTEVRISQAKMEESIKNIPTHDVPCAALTGHLEDAAADKKSWKDKIKGGVVDLVKTAIVAVITAAICIFNMKKGAE